MNIFQSSGFTTSSINGETINKQAYNAYYDNETGIIKTFNNGEIKDFVFDKKDVDHIFKTYFNNRLRDKSRGSVSLLNRLASDYDITIEPKDYSSSLKDVDSKLKSLFADDSKISKSKSKTKKDKTKKYKTKEKDNTKEKNKTKKANKAKKKK